MEIPKIEISAEKIADKVLDEIEFKGKNIREWAEYLIRNADDLISRQAAIDHLIDALYDLNEADLIDKVFFEEELKRVPSVQPEQRTGHWMPHKHTDTVLCSECDKCYGDEYNFCPNCGAKMEEVK